MPTSERQLRERIHRLFSPDCPAMAVEDAEHPAFWAPPPDGACEPVGEQLNSAKMTEDEWLNEPNPVLGGKSPNEILGGCDGDREKLENAICAVEEGAFS